MDQGNLWSQAAHDIALLNTDNEFNRAINEEDIDFNIPGLAHSAVKQSHGASVQDLIQKIENHPHRHALQRDLQQRQQFNPFSKESKDMIHDVENIELCELLDVEPKAQCKVCLSCWDVGIVYCTCGHFLRDGTEENKKFVKYTLDLHQWLLLCPVKLRKIGSGASNKIQTKLASFLEADEPTRMRMGNSIPDNNEDNIGGKGEN